jgi:hypothetical protein
VNQYITPVPLIGEIRLVISQWLLSNIESYSLSIINVI